MMKFTPYFYIFAFLVSTTTFSQVTTPPKENNILKKHDISIDFFNAFLNKYQLSYEHILNDYSSVGTSISYSPDIINVFSLVHKEKYSIKANYRFYFSKKRAQGFFVEDYLTYSKGKYLYFNNQTHSADYNNTYQSIYAGFNIGYKYVTKKDIFFEASAGFGRTIFNFKGYPNAFVPNIKLSIGKRF